ncbi:MAG TPA: DUF1080 domain-containing protein [Polyangiaceae bacterium]|nr:DUF1080 domain-containing protein [Polyangiaceae bacterium]
MRSLACGGSVLCLWGTIACGDESSPVAALGAAGSDSSAGSASVGGNVGTAGSTAPSSSGASSGGASSAGAATAGGSALGGATTAGTPSGGSANAAGSPSDRGGSAGSGGAVTNPDPSAPCAKCVRIFNGKDFDGWEAAPATWKIVDGAMQGKGGTSRAAYTKLDYGNFRLILTSRMNPVNGDHLGILFWGKRPTNPTSPEIDHNGWMQWMPPSGSMWSYPAGMHHVINPTKLANSPSSSTVWSTAELLFNLDRGTLRAAVDGVEITLYEHAKANPTEPIVKGPLAMMRHGGGTSEYKDIFVEVDPTEDRLYTVKPE